MVVASVILLKHICIWVSFFIFVAKCLSEHAACMVTCRLLFKHWELSTKRASYQQLEQRPSYFLGALGNY